MATVQAKYLTKNGSSNFGCTAQVGDTLRAEAVVSFTASDLLFYGSVFSARFRLSLPSGEFNYDTGLQTVTGTATFTSTPISAVQGTYTVLYVAVFDQYGTNVVQG